MVNSLESRGRSHVIPAHRAPSDEQRRWLSDRGSHITLATLPAEPAKLLAEVSMLLRVMGTRNGSEAEMAAVLKTYVSDLADFPLWAVTQACADFRRAEIGDGKFAPTPGELRKRVAEYVRPLIQEQATIGKILNAEVDDVPQHDAHCRRRRVYLVRKQMGLPDGEFTEPQKETP